MAHNHEHGHGCGCGHDHDHDHDDMQTVTITLEDDSELVCSIIGHFSLEDEKYEDYEYIALLPQDSEEILIYRYNEDGDSVDIDNIEDDEEFEAVSAMFQSILDEEMDEDEE